MIRTYYRLSLTVACALAAYIGPVIFLRYPYDLSYFAGGLAAAFIAWALLVTMIATEPGLDPGLQFILGAGVGVFTWAYVSAVAIFQIIPLIVENGWRLNDIFDPVWLMGGFSPLVVPAVAGWFSRTSGKPFWQTLSSALFRFSIPLAVLLLLPGWMGFPKQFRWLFLFTGIMFLVLDGLGTGDILPLVTVRRTRSDRR